LPSSFWRGKKFFPWQSAEADQYRSIQCLTPRETFRVENSHLCWSRNNASLRIELLLLLSSPSFRIIRVFISSSSICSSLCPPPMALPSSSSGACSSSNNLGPSAKAKLFPIMEETRKYDLALLAIAELVSCPFIARSASMPDDSKDWMRRSGNAVVLLKHIAGTAQAGNLNARLKTHPSSIDRSV